MQTQFLKKGLFLALPAILCATGLETCLIGRKPNLARGKAAPTAIALQKKYFISSNTPVSVCGDERWWWSLVDGWSRSHTHSLQNRSDSLFWCAGSTVVLRKYQQLNPTHSVAPSKRIKGRLESVGNFFGVFYTFGWIYLSFTIIVYMCIINVL